MGKATTHYHRGGIMGIARIPCADCNYCIQIGEGQGLCDYKSVPVGLGGEPKVVELFEINIECPHPKSQQLEVKTP